MAVRVRSEVDQDPSPTTTTTTTSSTSTRRSLLAAAAPLLSLSLLPVPPAAASTVPALDGVWFSLTGAPPDLYFPASSFLGEFEAVSTLVSAEAPLGEEALPPASLAGLRRAREEDLNKPLRYRTRFIRAPEGNPATPPNACVFDRAYNTLCEFCVCVLAGGKKKKKRNKKKGRKKKKLTNSLDLPNLSPSNQNSFVEGDEPAGRERGENRVGRQRPKPLEPEV